jgi:hypothetical protein
MAMKKTKPKNDTIDTAGKVAVSATKATTKALSATADTAEKLVIAAFKASIDPVKFLKQHIGSKKMVGKTGKMTGTMATKPKMPPKKPSSGAIPLKKR